jgi:hypothetical protein
MVEVSEIFFTGINDRGVRGAPALASVTRDQTPPELFVDGLEFPRCPL